MKLRLTTTLALTLLALTCPAAHYQVYLLGGQSNANGRGDAAQLTLPLDTPETDVRFYWHKTQSTSNGNLPRDTWIDLAPGSGHGSTTPVYPIEFGSEVSFGRALADANPALQIAVIKYSHGGTNLHTDWSPTGPRYASFVATVQAGLAALTAAGHTYVLRGMIWHQGEADAGSIPNATAYEANLRDLIDRVRQDVFEDEPKPFIVGSLSNSQNIYNPNPASGYGLVKQAQQTVTHTMEQVGYAETNGFPVRPTDPIHFSHIGQVLMGQAFAAEMLRMEAEANTPAQPGILLDFDFSGLTGSNLENVVYLDAIAEGVDLRAVLSPQGSLTPGTNHLAPAEFNLANWNAPTSNETGYLSFCLAPETDYELNLTNLCIRLNRATANAPSNFSVRTSLDGFAAPVGGILTETNSGPGVFRDYVFTFATLDPTESLVEIRVYATSGTGALHISDLILKGTALDLDADDDGLRIDEELTLGTDPDNPDSDGDGLHDGDEVRAGTLPWTLFPFSRWIEPLSVTSVWLEWPSKTGNVYQVERSTNLLDWTVIASSYPAAPTGSLTSWTGSITQVQSGTGILARYDAETGLNGNFNTTGFDSSDTEPGTTATRLVQGGSLSGGGANNFVLANALFDSSDSGSPGFNFGSVNTPSQTNAATAGDVFSFVLLPHSNAVTCTSLSFFTDQFGTSGKIDVSYTTNLVETFVLQNFFPVGGNAAVVKETIDFPDFTTSENITWTFYLYGAAADTHGTRFDDITLHGHTGTETVCRVYFQVRLEESEL